MANESKNEDQEKATLNLAGGATIELAVTTPTLARR